MEFRAAFKSDIGKRRKQNQDNGISLPELGLFVIADGMGGHQGGETASAMVVDEVPKTVKKMTKKKSWDPKDVLTQAISEANSAIFKKAGEKNTLHGMGTTTTALLFSDSKVTIGHVGDSRCYYFRPDSIWQLTRDHSLVAEKLRAGLITPEEAKTDQMKNVITRSVGFEPELEVDTYDFDVQAGDVFLVCSDGLNGMIEDDEILEVMQKDYFEKGDVEIVLDSLISAANEAGGEDNVSVLLVHVESL